MSIHRTIKKFPRFQIEEEKVKKYNWLFLKNNPEYIQAYNKLISEVSERVEYSDWHTTVLKINWSSPPTKNNEVLALIAEFRRCWKISEPVHPQSDLPIEVVFHKIHSSVAVVQTPEDLANFGLSATLDRLTKIPYKNKTREKSNWKDKPLYAIFLVDLRWATTSDISASLAKLKKLRFKSKELNENFSISEGKVKLMVENYGLFKRGRIKDITNLYQKDSLGSESDFIGRDDSGYTKEAKQDLEKFKSFNKIAPLIPFSFRKKSSRST